MKMLNRKKKKEPDNSLVGHLSELRFHIILSLILFLAVTIAAFQFSDLLVSDMVTKSRHTQFVYLSPAELFITYMKIAVVAGLLVSLPFFLNRIWVFVKPGLLPREVLVIKIALVFSFLLFVLGMIFSYLIVLPMTLDFLARFQTENITAMIGFDNYFNYISQMVFSFALIFELPILVVVLVSLGIFSTSFLREKRKYVLLIIVILAAVITPPDVISQIMLAVPMMLLFEIGIMAGSWVEHRRRKRKAAEEKSEGAPSET